MRKFDLHALQKCELEVLKEFIRVCEKNNLKYYLAWGTLIGAVRHQGFIPWDDDIDVCMPYEDYVRFKEVCRSDLGKDYFYEDWEAHSDYFLYWAKLRKNHTTCMTRSESNLKIHWGVGMDIFPLVKMDGPSCPMNKKIARFMLSLITNRAYLPYSADGPSKKIKKIIYKLVPQKLDKYIIKKCYSVLTKAGKNAEYYWDISDSVNRCCFKASVFGEGKKLLFENQMMNCPSDADTYLRKAYGDDYMLIPDVQDRINHGDIIVDLECDYTYYQENTNNK